MEKEDRRGRRERKGCFLLGQLHGEGWYWVQCRRKKKMKEEKQLVKTTCC